MSFVLSPVAFILLVLILPSVIGCDRLSVPPAVVTVTNVVEVVREVVVTNAVTDAAPSSEGAARVLSSRRTAPYLVAGRTLDDVQLRRLLANAGARVMECGPGAVALVEASDRVVSPLQAGGLLSVFPLRAADKIAADAGERVRIVPVSSIDVATLAAAVRESGGEVLEASDSGSPVIRARLSYAATRKLAARGDVRKIERDCK